MQRTTPTAQALPHGIGIQGGQGFYTMSSTVRGGAWRAGARARPQLLCRFVVWAQVVQQLDSSVSVVKNHTSYGATIVAAIHTFAFFLSRGGLRGWALCVMPATANELWERGWKNRAHLFVCSIACCAATNQIVSIRFDMHRRVAPRPSACAALGLHLISCIFKIREDSSHCVQPPLPLPVWLSLKNLRWCTRCFDISCARREALTSTRWVPRASGASGGTSLWSTWKRRLCLDPRRTRYASVSQSYSHSGTCRRLPSMLGSTAWWHQWLDRLFKEHSSHGA